MSVISILIPVLGFYNLELGFLRQIGKYRRTSSSRPNPCCTQVPGFSLPIDRQPEGSVYGAKPDAFCRDI